MKLWVSNNLPQLFSIISLKLIFLLVKQYTQQFRGYIKYLFKNSNLLVELLLLQCWKVLILTYSPSMENSEGYCARNFLSPLWDPPAICLISLVNPLDPNWQLKSCRVRGSPLSSSRSKKNNRVILRANSYCIASMAVFKPAWPQLKFVPSAEFWFGLVMKHVGFLANFSWFSQLIAWRLSNNINDTQSVLNIIIIIVVNKKTCGVLCCLLMSCKLSSLLLMGPTGLQGNQLAHLLTDT